jgi:hypothetical protein
VDDFYKELTELWQRQAWEWDCCTAEAAKEEYKVAARVSKLSPKQFANLCVKNPDDARTLYMRDLVVANLLLALSSPSEYVREWGKLVQKEKRCLV